MEGVFGKVRGGALASSAGESLTDCQKMGRMRDSAEKTRVGVESERLSLQRSHCVGTVQSERYLTPAVLVDHIIPLPRSHSFDNLQPLCSACHAVKTAAERTAKG